MGWGVCVDFLLLLNDGCLGRIFFSQKKIMTASTTLVVLRLIDK